MSFSSQAPSSTTPPATPILSQSAAALAIDGLFSGVLGGLTVAVFFLILDTLQGRPLYTPSLLGNVVFLGKSASEVTSVHIPMVFAYTGVHMAAFVVFGMAVAYMVRQFEQNPPLGLVLLLLFICFEAAFLAFAAALAPGVVGVLGASSVVAANVLAAVMMALYFRFAHPGFTRHLERIWED